MAHIKSSVFLINDVKQFEHFCKWFPKHDPEWTTQVEDVWMWYEQPDRWGPEKGIDLVFLDKNLEYWAIQAKSYASDYYVSKADIDSLLDVSNRKIISCRLLIATTDKLGVNAREVCAGQKKPVTRLMLSNFEQAQTRRKTLPFRMMLTASQKLIAVS